MFQPPVEKGGLAEMILSKEKQKKNKRKTKEKKTELLDWKCMTSRILSQNVTIIAISALPFHFFYVPKYPYTSMVANF